MIDIKPEILISDQVKISINIINLKQNIDTSK